MFFENVYNLKKKKEPVMQTDTWCENAVSFHCKWFYMYNKESQKQEKYRKIEILRLTIALKIHIWTRPKG